MLSLPHVCHTLSIKAAAVYASQAGLLRREEEGAMTTGHERAHLHDPLGAFCRHTPVALRGAASGLLQGLTFGVKDVFHVAGDPTGFGHPDWLRTQPRATVTATAVQRLQAVVAHMVGKT